MGSQKWTQWKIQQWRKKGSFSSKRETKKKKQTEWKEEKVCLSEEKEKRWTRKRTRKKKI